jgi:MFS family permease
MFSDLFLYGVILPVLPFSLESLIGVPPSEIQTTISLLLSIFSIVSIMFAPIAGIIADKSEQRKTSFIWGLIALTASTIGLNLGRKVWVLVVAKASQGLSAR